MWMFRADLTITYLLAHPYCRPLMRNRSCPCVDATRELLSSRRGSSALEYRDTLSPAEDCQPRLTEAAVVFRLAFRTWWDHFVAC